MAKKKKEEIVPRWIFAISGVLVILFVIFAGVSTLIAGAMGLIFGHKCAQWAFKIKKNTILAYIIGFVFGLVGLISYWVYYKISSKK